MKSIISKYSVHLCLLMFLSVFGVLFILSCEQTTGPGEDITEVANKLIIYTDKVSMQANKGSAVVFAKVYTKNDSTLGVKDVMVRFSVDNAATLSATSGVTDDLGYVQTTVYAGENTGTIRITASIENYSNAAFIIATPDTGVVDTNLNLRIDRRSKCFK